MMIRFMNALIVLATAMVLALPAMAATDAPLTGDQMFEVTKELYDRLDSLEKGVPSDRVSASVMENGTVILQGRVAAKPVSDAAEKLAKTVEGVRTVVNRIKIVQVAD